MNTDYDRHYRVLGVEPGCSWEDLRSAYRRLVRAWHPDHRPAASDDHSYETIKEITQAFRRLSDYRRRYGALPPAARHSDSAARYTGPPDPASPAAEAAAPVAPAPPRPRINAAGPSGVARYAVAGGTIAFGYLLLAGLLGDEWSSDVDPLFVANEQANVRAGSPDQPAAFYFGVGSSTSDVYRLHGGPMEVSGDTWYYGASKVRFSDNRVIAWESDPSFPLRADAYPSPNLPAVASFTIGSTKRHVQAVQGLPLSERGDVWDYGVVRVHFRQDRVIAWEVTRRRGLLSD